MRELKIPFVKTPQSPVGDLKLFKNTAFTLFFFGEGRGEVSTAEVLFKGKHSIVGLLFFFFFSTTLHAQDKLLPANGKIEANATLEPKEIRIGEQAQIKVNVKYPKGFELFWPELVDNIPVDSGHTIDIVQLSKIDTLNASDVVTQSRTITITGFDSGSYTIPPLVFGYREKNGDSIEQATTLPMLLTVNTVEVDTVQPPRPAKPPLDLPFSWSELKNYLFVGVPVLALLIILILYLVTRRKSIRTILSNEPALPPHLLAFKKLKEVDDRHYWQSGEVKKYYSEISDIVREYIETRYRVLALESTTYELMLKLNNTDINRLDRSNLKEMLELADLVKFAKVEPLPDEHFKAMTLAREFIEHTMQREPLPDESPKAE